MSKLSGYIVLKKESAESYGISGYCWKAYFRGTNNRVKRADGRMVDPYNKQADLRFDLLNNPMERGVIND